MLIIFGYGSYIDYLLPTISVKVCFKSVNGSSSASFHRPSARMKKRPLFITVTKELINLFWLTGFLLLLVELFDLLSLLNALDVDQTVMINDKII